MRLGALILILVLGLAHTLTPPVITRPRRLPPQISPLTAEEVDRLKQKSAPSLARVRASQSWSLDDAQLADLQECKEGFAKQTRYLSVVEQAYVILAIEVVYQAHSSLGDGAKLRHALAVGKLLASVRAEATTIEAALLAGVCEYTSIREYDLTGIFGDEVAESVTRLTKDVSLVWRLSELLEGDASFTAAPPRGTEPLGAEQLERQCQILLAGCDDSCSIIVSLASRLVSMRELHGALSGQWLGAEALSSAPRSPSNCALSCETACAVDSSEVCQAFQQGGGDEAVWHSLQRRKHAFARQTLEVFVPLAQRLSMWYFKTELEALSLAVLHPKELAEVQASLATVGERAAPALTAAREAIEAAVAADPIMKQHAKEVRVSTRLKDVASVWRKMQRKGLASVDEVGDLLALRIVVTPRQSRMTRSAYQAHQAMLCYRVLEVLHSVCPLARCGDGFKDYITQPKPNGYRSLHSRAVVDGGGGGSVGGGGGGGGGGGLVAEVQVRTMEMHRTAEYGAAAHWLYKSGEARRRAADELWVPELRERGDGWSGSSGSGGRDGGRTAASSEGPAATRSRAGAVSASTATVGVTGAAAASNTSRPPRSRWREGGLSLAAQGERVKRKLSRVHDMLRSKQVLATTSDGVVLCLQEGTTIEDALRSLSRLEELDEGVGGSPADAPPGLEKDLEEGATDVPRRSTAGMGGGGSDSGASGNDGGGSGSGASGNDSGGAHGRSRLWRALVNGNQLVKPSYQIKNGDVLCSPREAIWHSAKTEADRDSIEEQAADDAGVLPDTVFWAQRVPWPWSLLQSQRPEDGEAWFAEAERKNGNVALIGASTWLWLVALGWVHVDAAPLSGISGISGACWAMQAITYSLFEARSLLRNTLVRTKAMGPNLGPLEPPIWLGRSAMIAMAALALHTDLMHDGGILHDFLQDAPEAVEKVAELPVVPYVEVPSLVADVLVLLSGT